MISSGSDLGIFGHNATFQKRVPKDIEQMKGIITVSEKNNSEQWRCQKTFYTKNINDYEFITQRKSKYFLFKNVLITIFLRLFEYGK